MDLGHRRLAALVSALALCLVAAVLGVAEPPSAQADPDPGHPRLATGTGSDVSVTAAVLRAAQVGDSFTLDLPGGAATAVVSHRDEQALFTGWSGEVGRSGWFYAVESPDGSVRIDVDLEGGVYTIEGGRDGYVGRLHPTVAYEEVDDSVTPPAQAPLSSTGPGADEAAAGRTHWLKVLIVYTPKARRLVGGLKKIKMLARAGINQANAAFKNSRINARFVLAGVKNARSKEASLAANLKSLWKRDGRFDRVPRMRNRAHADLVQMISWNADKRGYCGFGYLRPRARYAYSITTARCAVRAKGTAHELGHNLGADHDATAGYKPTSKLPARGYVNLDRRWITVMAYWTKCTNAGIYCRKIPYFSNPKVKLNGARTGRFGKADNHVVINRRADEVQRFRR